MGTPSYKRLLVAGLVAAGIVLLLMLWVSATTQSDALHVFYSDDYIHVGTSTADGFSISHVVAYDGTTAISSRLEPPVAIGHYIGERALIGPLSKLTWRTGSGEIVTRSQRTTGYMLLYVRLNSVDLALPSKL